MQYHSVYTSEILINARLNVLLSVRFAQLNVSFCYMYERNIVDSGEISGFLLYELQLLINYRYFINPYRYIFLDKFDKL